MSDADETVQKLLQSLRNAKPAADMEQRILTAMQDATDAGEAAKASRRWVSWPGSSRLGSSWLGSSWLGSSRQALAMGVAGAAVLALGLVLIVLSHPHPRTLTKVSGHTAHAAADQTPRTLAATRKPFAHSAHVAPVTPLNRVTLRARSRRSFADEGSAPNSYPPPPLPLTQQERLLLRLAHSRDPGSLTILNPEVQSAQTARATEQFQQFFGMNEQEMRSQLE